MLYVILLTYDDVDTVQKCRFIATLDAGAVISVMSNIHQLAKDVFDASSAC